MPKMTVDFGELEDDMTTYTFFLLLIENARLSNISPENTFHFWVLITLLGTRSTVSKISFNGLY